MSPINQQKAKILSHRYLPRNIMGHGFSVSDGFRQAPFFLFHTWLVIRNMSGGLVDGFRLGGTPTWMVNFRENPVKI